MKSMTHKVTSGLKSGLHVRILKHGAWVLVQDNYGVEHKVRNKQLAPLTAELIDIAPENDEVRLNYDDVLRSSGAALSSDDVSVVPAISTGISESLGDASSWMPDIDYDPSDVNEVLRALDEEQEMKNMSSEFQIRRAKYKETDGCGDELQMLLKGFSPMDVIAIAEKLLDMNSGDLLRRYSHLNNGQKRMNAGNRIRSLIKKGQKTVEDVHAAIEVICFGDESE
ncbi:TPA: hypothetical protein ACK21Z_002610 [Vibrio harveyi]|uniref:hypothetical protein n=1 Tax=Vibrio harveyi TaxID=669 RepID=UPI00237EF0EF|nr:hypothetical protein [Vibrio harveyi]HDM8070307.1 hypothetical protein [Vibrio harveyi]